MKITDTRDLNYKKNAYIISKLRNPLILIVITFSISIFGLTVIPGLDTNGNEVHMGFFDALFFVLYTATTIGYGEGENPLTYLQKVWVFLSIIFTVVTWFYAISKIVSIFQDKDFMNFLILTRQQNKIKKVNNDFIILSGYSYSAKQLINKILETKHNLTLIIIENNAENNTDITLNYTDKSRVIHLNLECSLKESLILAGVKYKNCKAVIALSELQRSNLKTTINARFLNENIKIINHTKTKLEDREFKIIGENKSINSYKIIAEELLLLFKNPELSNLINWLHSGTLTDTITTMEQRSMLVIGHGNLGTILDKKLRSHLDKLTFIDVLENEDENVLLGDARYPETITKQINFEEYELVFITTKDDYTNYIIAQNIYKIDNNKKVFVKINYEINEPLIKKVSKEIKVFNIDKILAHESYYMLMNEDFLKITKYFKTLEKEEITQIYSYLIQNFDKPLYEEISITSDNAYALYNKIDKGFQIPYTIFEKNYNLLGKNKGLLILFIIRNKETIKLDIDIKEDIYIEKNDKVFFIYDNDNGIENTYKMMRDSLELKHLLEEIKNSEVK